MTPIAFPPQTSRRLHNQIERALRRTYGATTGLRIVVTMSTRELLSAGASREQIRQAFADCVRMHAPPQIADPKSQHAESGQREKLIDSMIEWADQVCTSSHARRAAAT